MLLVGQQEDILCLLGDPAQMGVTLENWAG